MFKSYKKNLSLLLSFFVFLSMPLQAGLLDTNVALDLAPEARQTIAAAVTAVREASAQVGAGLASIGDNIHNPAVLKSVEAVGADIRVSTYNLNRTLQDISHTINYFPQSLIAPFKNATLISLGFVGAVISLIMLKKGIEKSINESKEIEQEKKSTLIQYIKTLNKKGIVLTGSSLALLVASIATIVRSENIIKRLGGLPVYPGL